MAIEEEKKFISDRPLSALLPIPATTIEVLDRILKARREIEAKPKLAEAEYRKRAMAEREAG